MNLPNQLTVSRIILTVVYLNVLYIEGFWPKFGAALLFVIASITDFFDGYIARTQNLITDFGKLMDPIADKFLTLGSFFVFAQMFLIAYWMFALIAIREIYITIWRLSKNREGVVLAADDWGKYKTVAQIVTIGVVLLYLVIRETRMALHWTTADVNIWFNVINGLMWATVVITVASGVKYLIVNRKK